MRNYIQLVFAAVADDATNTISVYGWFQDEKLATEFLAAVFPGFDPTLNHTILENWYIALNKFQLLNVLNFTPPVVRTAFMSQTAPKNWNSNNKAFSISPRIDGSIPATKPVSQKSKGGTISMSLLTYLKLLLRTWSTPGLPPPAVTAPQRWNQWLARLIDDYVAGKLTVTQVYALLNGVVFSAKVSKIP